MRKGFHSLLAALIATASGNLIITPTTYACAIFTQSYENPIFPSEKMVLVGNNEDNMSPSAQIHFVPAGPRAYGYMYYTLGQATQFPATNPAPKLTCPSNFGFPGLDQEGFPQGGMNK